MLLRILGGIEVDVKRKIFIIYVKGFEELLFLKIVKMIDEELEEDREMKLNFF